MGYLVKFLFIEHIIIFPEHNIELGLIYILYHIFSFLKRGHAVFRIAVAISFCYGKCIGENIKNALPSICDVL